MKASPQQGALYEQALRLEPRLCAVDTLVRTLAKYAPTPESGKALCAGCLWVHAMKRMITPLVGWERHYRHEDAREPEPTVGLRTLETSTLDELLAPSREPRPVTPADVVERWIAEGPAREPAGTPEETWMRSSEAYEAVAHELLRVMHEADPGNGHGGVVVCERRRPDPVTTTGPDAPSGGGS